MRRGEVREYVPSSGNPVRVLVVSNDAHNDRPGSWPVCVDIIRRPSVLAASVVSLADPDPLGGALDVSTIRPLPPARLKGPVGMLTGATLSRFADAVRAFLDV